MAAFIPSPAAILNRTSSPISVPIPFFQQSMPAASYPRAARAYMANEIVYACVEMLASSSGEPQITGYRWRRNSPERRNRERALVRNGIPKWYVKNLLALNGYTEEISGHPLVKLLNNPNPYMTRGQLVGTLVMDQSLAGNWYLYKARHAASAIAGATGELWRLRPDRVRILPGDGGKGIQGYEYRVGREAVVYPPEDIIHYKRRHPYDDFYGMPPLMPILNRIDIDVYMSGFLRKFFESGGTGPGAVLTVKAQMTQKDKDEVRNRLLSRFSGPAGWFETLVLDNTESTYQQMGLNRGLRDALPKEIDAVTEARIAMAFGIPGSILGLLIGYESSSYANKRQDWQVFWDLTMAPLLSDFDDTFNLTLTPEFGGIDEVAFDLSDIRALQEDVDKIHDRHRRDVLAGLESWEEGREAIGLDPDVRDGTFLIPSTAIPMKRKAMDQPPALPEPVIDALRGTFMPPQLPSPEIVAEVYCPNCGRWVGRNMNVGATAYCPKCKEVEVG